MWRSLECVDRDSVSVLFRGWQAATEDQQELKKIEAQTFRVVDNHYGAWNVEDGDGNVLSFDLGQNQATRVANICSRHELWRVTVQRNIRMIRRRMQDALRKKDTRKFKKLIWMLGDDLGDALLFQKPWDKKPRKRGISRWTLRKK